MNQKYHFHFSGPMPNEFKDNPDEYGKFPKGVSNRNAGLEYVLKHVNETADNSGVIYFADDDNTYDPQLFEEGYIFENLNGSNQEYQRIYFR